MYDINIQTRLHVLVFRAQSLWWLLSNQLCFVYPNYAGTSWLVSAFLDILHMHVYMHMYAHTCMMIVGNQTNHISLGLNIYLSFLSLLDPFPGPATDM